jgi:hypothetical protein
MLFVRSLVLEVALGALVVNVIAIGPKVRGFKPGQRRLKSATLLLRRESRRLHVVRFYGMLKNPIGMKEIFCRQEFNAISSASLLMTVLVKDCQRALVNKSEIIRMYK